jgi:hypothetical protein
MGKQTNKNPKPPKSVLGKGYTLGGKEQNLSAII